METEPERRAVQSDPKNVLPANDKRIRASFGMIVLIFVALALTAVLIWLRG
jgi:hypothetical protein